ncbi:unnamed protein product [Dicrocoelium dendriticum]|nr:unnamed protein product [Dicrocoelium dendriticum]
MPWSWCHGVRHCNDNRSNVPGTRSDQDEVGLEAFTGGFPISVVDIFPPSMLPKLPNYQECMEIGDPPTADEDVATNSHPLPPRPYGYRRAHTPVPVESRSSSHSECDSRRLVSSLPSTPPPNYSSQHSPSQSDDAEPTGPT